MLKHHSATALLHRSRLSLTSPSCPTPSNTASSSSASVSTCNQLKMAASTESTVHQPRASDDTKQQKPKAPPFMYFPMGYKEAAYQWWTNVTPRVAERNVFSLIPALKEAFDSISSTTPSASPDAPGTRVWRRSLVQLSGKNRAINEICVEKVGEENEETLVMLHGYGAGAGYFYRNLEPISRMPGLKLYALDMLGMGNSTRPPFKIHAKKKEEQVIEAENFFVDALEEWRKARKIERFTLLGHSLGGYLAVSYAIKYPGHLKKLILASPVGIPEDPYAVNAKLPEPGESTLENEFTQDQQSITQDGGEVGQKVSPKAAAKKTNTPRRPVPSWLVWLWDANISPFGIVRAAGPLGPKFVSGWSTRRFNHLPANESQALHEYSFSIFKQKGSGEYALAYILAPGAYARRPVINRIQDVGRQPLPPSQNNSTAARTKETGIPIVFLYGENDWMDVAGGLASEEKLKQAKTDALLHATEEEKRNENGSARVAIVPKAGHNLFLDNPEDFNVIIRKEMDETSQAERNASKRP